MSDKDWRPGVEGGDYFLHQQKQLAVADRRPVIRQASDLVGPGINSAAITLDNFNDLLATFNGYYSGKRSAANAPESSNATDVFVGTVINDSEFGGIQQFTSVYSGDRYTRVFTRSPIDAESLAWGPWKWVQRVPPTISTDAETDTTAYNGASTALSLPQMSISNGAGTYETSGTSLLIKRPGIYTGHAQVGDRVGSTVATIALWRPQSSTTVPTTHLSVPLGPTFYIPFTFRATDANQGLYVTMSQSSGSTRAIWWRLEMTRVGDVD